MNFFERGAAAKRKWRCPEMTEESDGKWRCGKASGHLGVHQAYKRGQWFSIWWGTEDGIDQHFGIT